MAQQEACTYCGGKLFYNRCTDCGLRKKVCWHSPHLKKNFCAFTYDEAQRLMLEAEHNRSPLSLSGASVG